MEDPASPGILTPLTPPARSVGDLRKTYISRAKCNDALRRGEARARFTASAKTFGAEWGVGVGLHFELMKWLRWLFLFLIICAVPFMIVIGCSVFTDATHMDDHTYGIKKYPASKIHSLTFAAIVDDTIDNGTLQYMNTQIWRQWKGPMYKSTFLTWISLVDAGAMLLFCAGLVGVWYHLKRFADYMDRTTLEAADYTVLVRGLPVDADAAQVGEHFSRYGDVMDVVLVTDRLSTTLAYCGRASHLQQKRAMVLDAAAVRNGRDEHLPKLEKLDERIAGIAEDIREVAEKPQCVRAAFVTFNSENERRACMKQCPNSWLSCLIQPRSDRYLNKCRFWVRRAAAPEDYTLEHLAVAEWQLAARELFVWVVTLVLVLLCAAAITKLTDVSNAESSTLKWYSSTLYTNTAAAVRTGKSAVSVSTTTARANRTAQLSDFCSAELSTTCSQLLSARINNTASVRLRWGSLPLWNTSLDRLLFERPLTVALQGCAYGLPAGGNAASGIVGSGSACGLETCLPCMCLGVSETPSITTSAAGRVTATQICQPYINQWDVRSWGIRLAISLVVAVLNSAIKWLLRGLVRLGRHWTHTDRERSFALQCFLAMLVNTVAVLLLTNAQSLGELARESPNGAWLRYFVRYGAYDDFSALWYENVGLSIMILMCINVASPLVNIATEAAWQALLRCRVHFCLTWPLQGDYDEAWARPRFTLEHRTADLLLNASLALLFGSGMPLLYLVFAGYLLVAELADRWALTKLCAGSPRYSKGLMRLVMGLLPWMAVAHCAFGLWMHTYFRVVAPADATGALVGGDMASLSAAVRATNARLSGANGDLNALQSSGTWQRITQPNGLALLLLFVLLSLWLLIGRYIVWRLAACVGRAAARACCPHSWLMRLQLDTEVASVACARTYADALVARELHGTPTYRLAHHPHYTQYFAASGLNRAVGVAALAAAAASGGAGRNIYTRLRTVRKRGTRLAGAPSFQILPHAITDSAAASEGTSAGVSAGASKANLSVAAGANTDDTVATAGDRGAGNGVVFAAAMAALANDKVKAAAAANADVKTKDAEDVSLPPIKDGDVIKAAQPVQRPRPAEAMVRGPDVVDAVQLLAEEEELAAVLEASAREYAALQQQQQGQRYPQVEEVALPSTEAAVAVPMAVGDGVVVVVETPNRQQPAVIRSPAPGATPVTGVHLGTPQPPPVLPPPSAAASPQLAATPSPFYVAVPSATAALGPAPATASCVITASGGAVAAGAGSGRLFGASALRIELPGETAPAPPVSPRSSQGSMAVSAQGAGGVGGPTRSRATLPPGEGTRPSN
ncbi:hypothetical protein HYH02_007192 [Chlamydomonas schloesseri]|uniref:RRM domain-containing protein n=1 Tax=Chlamydomonas schloesseri TaxID=2026947 RepID=A0A835WHP3_9CHLO|nr:hypothetical protein HYH02_007192 [Chlamydomonas schloesseri]|eukprot:KAG2447732.1 hypothetical protein HYH02_007192 [Chlamydomonas schloesseri]